MITLENRFKSLGNMQRHNNDDKKLIKALAESSNCFDFLKRFFKQLQQTSLQKYKKYP